MTVTALHLDAPALAGPALNKKAVSLLSGGLDSLLSAKVVALQGIEVKAITFATDFGCGTGTGGGCGTDTRGLQLGFDIKFCHLGEVYNRMVKSPRFGYGSNMNPCIDCRMMMLAAGWEYAQAVGATWIITGEVLEQRPMSQRRPVMGMVERELGLAGRVLRPLSARRLEPTLMERQGIVDRERLYDFHGRGRRPQMELARRLGIERYPTPAGGCLLTDPEYSRKVRDLFLHLEGDTPSSTEVRLLQFGRNFRLGPRTKGVVGRELADNLQIEAHARERDWLLLPASHNGPFALVVGPASGDDLFTVARIAASYSKGEPGERILYDVRGPGATRELAVEKPAGREWFANLWI